MSIKLLLSAFSISLSIGISAQWDTLNTGVTYRLNSIAADDIMGVVAVGFNPATDSGAYGTMVYSVDNGNSWWEQAEDFSPNLELWDVDCISNNRAWIVGDSGVVVLRTIVSNIYTSAGHISPYSLRCGYPVNDSVFYCAGEHGVTFRTTNYGVSWDTLSTGTLTNINDIYFEDAANGWIAADGGYLAMTSDSGNTWDFVSQPFWGFADYNSVALQGSTGLNPYVVGESGIALFSNNSGTNWFSLATDTTVNLNAVRFGTQNAGLICGDNGFIFRSDNGGATWISETSASTDDLYDIAFAGDTTAFICGDSGVVLRSNIDISSVHTTTSASLSAHAYPNPFSDNLSVNVTLESTQDVEILITDVTGQLLSTSKYSNTNSGANRFEISGTENIASGLYFITVIANERKSVLPVVRN